MKTIDDSCSLMQGTYSMSRTGQAYFGLSVTRGHRGPGLLLIAADTGDHSSDATMGRPNFSSTKKACVFLSSAHSMLSFLQWSNLGTQMMLEQAECFL
jgi:hypothetical protein